jgi:hypothetical protein
LALRKRLKASWISAGVHGFGLADFFATRLGDALADFLATAFADFFGTDGTRDFFACFARMILAMIRVY